MTDHDIYRDIATRAGGDIYIGVVGPVRTGKSTFIKVLAGIVPKDDGIITVGKNTKISYLEQDKIFEPEHTVLMEVFKGTQPLMRALYDYELALQASQKNPHDSALQEKIINLSGKIDELRLIKYEL